MDVKPSKQVLDYYSKPGKMTSSRKYTAILKKLPKDVTSLARIVQGLVIHEYVASSFYGVNIPDDRKGESHIRRFSKLLDRIFALDDGPLTKARPPKHRLVGVCDHFAKLFVSILRIKGIPSRMRYGFGDYFNPGFYEDHSLCEYWNAREKRWVLVDSQFDEVWRKELHIKHDVFDVPRDRFLVACNAWTMCRYEKADPSKFGIFQGNLRGLWFVAGNLVKDVAALNKMEMLQWDGWGAIPKPNSKLKNDKLKLFDQLATLTNEPDTSFNELRKIYKEKEKRLEVPGKVFNALRRRLEKI
jgi:hypothetical protein